MKRHRNPAWAPQFQIDPDTTWQEQLLDAEAESSAIDADTVEFTPELQQAWHTYNYDLRQTLGDWLASKRLDPALLDEMYAAHAEYNVYMTLRGHGVGIWDGRWDHFLTDDQIEDLTDVLKERLAKHVDDSGGGAIDMAMDDAVYRGKSPVPNPVRTLKRRLLR